MPGEDFVNFAGNIEVGTDGAGYDVTFHSDTSGDKLFWDTSEKSLRVIGTSGNPALYVAGGHLDIQATDDSTDATGDTGALRCEGGASIAKKVFVGTDLSVGGHMTGGGLRGYFAFGEGATLTSTQYLSGPDGATHTAAFGYDMPRAGSITAVSVCINASSVSDSSGPDFKHSHVVGKVQIDGTDKISATIAGASNGDTSYSAGKKDLRTTQSIGTDTFSAGENLMVQIVITNFTQAGTSSTSITDVTVIVECTFDA